MKRDQLTFADHFDMTSYDEFVHYHANLDFDPEPDDLIIIDEIDYFIYGDTGRFYFF